MKNIAMCLLVIIVLGTLAIAGCAQPAPSPKPTAPALSTPKPAASPKPTAPALSTPKPAASPKPTAPAPTTPKPAATSSQRLVFASLSPGTVNYATFLGMSQLVNQYTSLKTLVQPYPSLPQLYPALRKGDADMINISTAAMQFYGFGVPTAVDPRTPPGAYPEGRILVGGNLLYFGWLTRADTGIKTIPDLKGKTVTSDYKTTTNSSTLGKWALRAYGLDYAKDVNSKPYEDSSKAVDDMAAGKLHAAWGNTGPQIQELQATKGVFMLSLPPDKGTPIQTANPGTVYYTLLEPGYFSYIAQPTGTLGFQSTIVASDKMSDDVAYTITKTVMERSQELVRIAVEFKEWGIKNSKAAIPENFIIPMHPGAIKYYKEKGLWTSAMEARQTERLKAVAAVTPK